MLQRKSAVNRKVKGILASLLAGAVLTGSGPVFAAEAEQNLEAFVLNPMVITATRTEMSLKENPLSVNVVGHKELEQTQAKTLKEALKSVMGVTIFNDFQGRSNVRIRGSESRHVLIMVDGKRLGGELSYNSANAWDVDRIRMEDVEKVEIIRGPAGALYGSDAIGGVINVITKNPETDSAQANYEYGWYDDGKGAGYKGNLYIQGKDGKYFYKLNGGVNNNRPHSDPDGGNDDMNFFGEELPFSASVGYEASNGNRLTFDFSRIHEDNQKMNTTVTDLSAMMGGGGKPDMGGGNMKPDMGNGGMKPDMGNGGMKPDMGNGGMKPDMGNGGMKPDMGNGGMKPDMGNGGMKPDMGNGGMKPDMGKPDMGKPDMSGGMPDIGDNKIEQYAYKTVYNDNTRKDFAITYEGDDQKHDWMLRAYRSKYDKSYTSTRLKQLYLNGKPGPGKMGAIKHEKPKKDFVERTLSVMEGRDSVHINDKNLFTFGAEYREDESEGTRLWKGNTTGENLKWKDVHDASDKATLRYAAGYIQNEFLPDENWIIIPSVRFDWSDKFSNKWTSRLATTYSPEESLRFKAVVGQGYKTPTVNELYHYWEMYPGGKGHSGEFFEGNPNLEPETSLDWEIAIEKDFGNKTTVHLGYFHNKVKDLIESVYTGRDTTPMTHPGTSSVTMMGNKPIAIPYTDNIMTYHNVPEAVLQGVELYGNHQIGNDMSLNFGYMYLDASNRTSNLRLTDRARHQITLGYSYRPENIYAWDFNMDLIANLDYYCTDHEHTAMGHSVYKNENFTIWNIMTGKNINDDTRIYLGIDNVSNHQNFGSFADGNLGRLYRFGMEYKF